METKKIQKKPKTLWKTLNVTKAWTSVFISILYFSLFNSVHYITSFPLPPLLIIAQKEVLEPLAEVYLEHGRTSIKKLLFWK